MTTCRAVQATRCATTWPLVGNFYILLATSARCRHVVDAPRVSAVVSFASNPAELTRFPPTPALCHGGRILARLREGELPRRAHVVTQTDRLLSGAGARRVPRRRRHRRH